ncbi:hypothetical protein Bca101_092236 [Brassica carinata]
MGFWKDTQRKRTFSSPTASPQKNRSLSSFMFNLPKQRLLPAGTKSNLKVLLKKANMEELSSLQEVLSEPNIDLVTELVKEEIQKRR